MGIKIFGPKDGDLRADYSRPEGKGEAHEGGPQWAQPKTVWKAPNQEPAIATTLPGPGGGVLF